MKFKDYGVGDLTNQTFNGNIDISTFNLTSLEGRPKIVNGNFYCNNNDNLETLKYSPKIINGNFDCSKTNITSLKYMPEEIKNNFDCDNNKLTSLEHCAKKINGYLNCKCNKDLTNVKEQIIKYGIRADRYITDEGDFTFKQIEKRFEKRRKNELIIKEKIKKNKNIDYGLSL